MKYFTNSSFGFNKVGIRLKRFAIIFLVVLSFALMLLGKADVIIIEKAQVFALEIINPIMKIITSAHSRCRDAHGAGGVAE